MTEEELEIILSHLMDEQEKRGVAISPLLLTIKPTDYIMFIWKQEQQS